MITAEQCKINSVACTILAKAPKISIERATILAAMARKWAELADETARFDATIQEEWMAGWMTALKVVESRLHLGRFKEPIYYLTDPISWKPNPGQENGFKRVEAPKGFVSDLASIPRVFWSVLRPDGEYAYAAIIHDYLYWEQTGTRKHADDILKLTMEDLKINPQHITLIYEGVRVGGQSAWDENARLKEQGEKRLLVQEPPTAAMTWAEWKMRPDVFAQN